MTIPKVSIIIVANVPISCLSKATVISNPIKLSSKFKIKKNKYEEL